MESEVKKLNKSGRQQLKKLEDIVQKSFEEQNLISENLLNPPKEILTKTEELSDRVARFGGSWAFIITFLVLLVAWICFNSIAPKLKAFDPYPFILMNLVLSCVAALQAPIIMMSQNRQEEKDRKRGQNDYMINLKAELELRALHQKIDLLLKEQTKDLYRSQAKQLEILQNIEDKINRIGKS